MTRPPDPRHGRWTRLVRCLAPPALGLLVLCVGCGAPEPAPEALAKAAPPEASPLGLAGEPYPEPLPKPALVLRDTDGRLYDLRAETEGALTLLFFGYTSCPDVCPVHLEQVASVLRRDRELRRRVRVVFVSVDPARDTPERLRAFLDRFDPRFVGLVGSPAELEVAQEQAGVPPAEIDQRFEGGYSVSHAAWIIVYTPDGRARFRYPFGTRQVDWSHDLHVLLEHAWPDA